MYTDRSTAISSLFLVLPVHVAGDGLRKGEEPRGGNSDGREGSWFRYQKRSLSER